ncbi:MAG: bacteriocin-protection protein [Gemmatimonadetes bacterium]|jgi:uncharacterized protein YdeI (YjbR/CyaY-like superfamily)|nr:bacteriocin-protection protein [Gemmatimonadota bacterium]
MNTNLYHGIGHAVDAAGRRTILEPMTAPHYFAWADAFRDWLHAHHASERELLVGFWKKGTGQPTMTWSESVDEALCYGWIDGVRRSVDDERYSIRFTPRKPGSIWSRVNMAKVEVLIAAGRMQPAGLAAWERRTDARSGVYLFEQESVAFDAESEALFQKHATAWEFFQAQPAGYRKLATGRVMNAKRPETRERRLASLIEASACGERLL